MEIVETNGEFKFTFSCRVSNPGHNCGMGWLTDMTLVKSRLINTPKLVTAPQYNNRLNISTPSPDWSVPVLTLKEAWDFWDRNKESILKCIYSSSIRQKPHGFYLISDSVNVQGDTNWGQKKAGQEEFPDGFTKTVHFMNWVAARQIGNLVRGPIGNNLAHTEDNYVNNEGRCVTSWFWQPSSETIIDPNVVVLSNAFEANQKYPKLLQNCKEYVDYELSLIPKAESEFRRAA